MSYYAKNPLEADWDRHQTEDHAENVRIAESVSGYYFDAAVAPFKDEYDATMRDLLGMTGPRWHRARDAAKAKWTADTAVARALYEASVEWMLANNKGELSEEFTDQWDAMIADAEAMTKAASPAPRVVVVGDHDAEIAA